MRGTVLISESDAATVGRVAQTRRMPTRAVGEDDNPAQRPAHVWAEDVEPNLLSHGPHDVSVDVNGHGHGRQRAVRR